MRGLVLLGMGVLAAACGGLDDGGRISFSQADVQAYLEREVARTLPGLTVGAAACPALMPERVGATINCTVVVEDVPVDYEVQRLAGERFEARPARPVVVVRDVAAAVKAKLGSQAAEVRCGDAVVTQPAADEALTCQVTGPGPDRTAVVRVAADGTITVTDS